MAENFQGNEQGHIVDDVIYDSQPEEEDLWPNLLTNEVGHKDKDEVKLVEKLQDASLENDDNEEPELNTSDSKHVQDHPLHSQKERSYKEDKETEKSTKKISMNQKVSSSSDFFDMINAESGFSLASPSRPTSLPSISPSPAFDPSPLSGRSEMSPPSSEHPKRFPLISGDQEGDDFQGFESEGDDEPLIRQRNTTPKDDTSSGNIESLSSLPPQIHMKPGEHGIESSVPLSLSIQPSSASETTPAFLENAISPPHRTLRTRKPEQQMPYTLDLLRHRAQFQVRGLKPVQNPDSHLSRHSHNNEDKSDRDFVAPMERTNGTDEERPMKRRRSEFDGLQSDLRQERQRRKDGERIFVDPQQYDHEAKGTNRKEKDVKRTTIKESLNQEISDHQMSIYDFDVNSDDGGFLDLPIFGASQEDTSSRQLSYTSPSTTQIITTRRPLTPRSANTVLYVDSPKTTRNVETSKEIEESFASDAELSPQTRRESSSSSDLDSIPIDLQRFKRRIRGVLPGSFFSVQDRESHSLPKRSNQQRHRSVEDRRGVAKIKFRKIDGKERSTRHDSLRINDSSDNDDVENIPMEKRIIREVVDLTPDNEVPSAAVDGEDDQNASEEDLIDRMTSGSRTFNGRRPRIYQSRLRMNYTDKSLGLSRTRNRGSYQSNQGRKQQKGGRKSSALRSTPRRQQLQTSRLSIIDACDAYTHLTSLSPPRFMKVARRQAKKQPDFGRGPAPNTRWWWWGDRVGADSHREFLEGVRDWREGNWLPQGLEKRIWKKTEERSGGSSRNSVPFTSSNLQGGIRQKYQSEAHSHPTLLDIRSMQSNIVTDLPARAQVRKVIKKVPRPPNAVFSNKVQPSGIFRDKERVGNPWRLAVKRKEFLPTKPAPSSKRRGARHVDDIASWLGVVSTEQLNNANNNDLGTQPPQSRSRRKRTSHRVDRYRFEELSKGWGSFQRSRSQVLETDAYQQTLLDDLWFLNHVNAVSFGFVPIESGVFLDANTFVGRGLLASALKTKVNVENEEDDLRIRQECDYAKLTVSEANEKLEADCTSLLEDLAELHQSTAEFVFVREAWLRFSEFLVLYLASLSSKSHSGVLAFGAKLLGVVELSLDRLSVMDLSDVVNMLSSNSLMSLGLLQTFLVALFQLVILTSSDIAQLGADKVMCRVGKLLLNGLVMRLDFVQDILREQRAKRLSGDGLACDSQMLDSWTTVLHVFDHISMSNSEHSVPSFWRMLETTMHIKDNEKSAIRTIDRYWYCIMNISAISLFNQDGISLAPNCRFDLRRLGTLIASDSIWVIVENLVRTITRLYVNIKDPQLISYIRTTLCRCLSLVEQWGWSFGAKVTIMIIYNFFAERRFDNLEIHFSGFPNFFSASPSLSVSASDNVFMIFLKFIASVIRHQVLFIEAHKEAKFLRKERELARKDLERLINRTIPLRTYSVDCSEADFRALQNHFSLLLTLYCYAPESSRPSVERIRDVIDIEKAPCQACIASIDAWHHLIRFQIQKQLDISTCKEWYFLLLEYPLGHYQKARKKTTATGATEHTNDMQRSSRRDWERILIRALISLKDVSSMAPQLSGSLVEGAISRILRLSYDLPDVVVVEALELTKSFFASLSDIIPALSIVPKQTEDSQDYGDITFLEEYAAAEESPDNRPPEYDWIPTISILLYRLLSDTLENNVRRRDQIISDTIDCWSSSMAMLVRLGQRTWESLLRYGGEWERLRSNSSQAVRSWIPYVMTKIITIDVQAYFTSRDTFISAWFETIVEPDLGRQHIFTNALLNVDDHNIALSNPPFSKDSTTGLYDISADAIFELRPSLIIHALANLGRKIEETSTGGDSAATTMCRQKFLSYLERMLSTMRSVYLGMTNARPDIVVQYVSLSQHVIGNILQYCSSFAIERDFPELAWFMDEINFPQPVGKNSVLYQAQRMRSYARKGTGMHYFTGTQLGILSYLRTILENCLRNNREDDFVLLCEAALFDQSLPGLIRDTEDVNLRCLRQFVVQGIFCEFFAMIADSPEESNPCWSTVLVILRVIRKLYSRIWDTLQSTQRLEIMAVLEDVSTILLALLQLAPEILKPCGSQLSRIMVARVFDFVLLIKHIARFLDGWPDYKDILFRVNGLLHIFMLLSQSKPISIEDQIWTDGLRKEQRAWDSLRRAVREGAYRAQEVAYTATLSDSVLSLVIQSVQGCPCVDQFDDGEAELYV